MKAFSILASISALQRDMNNAGANGTLLENTTLSKVKLKANTNLASEISWLYFQNKMAKYLTWHKLDKKCPIILKDFTGRSNTFRLTNHWLNMFFTVV